MFAIQHRLGIPQSLLPSVSKRFPKVEQVSLCYVRSPFRRHSLRVYRKLWHTTRTGAIVEAESALGNDLHVSSRASLKSQLQHELVDVKRGIFGVKAAKGKAIDNLLCQLEEQQLLLRPTEDLEGLNGSWQLLYTSLTIKGVQKTKLGLREFVALGDFYQTIDCECREAVSTVCFSVTGLGTLSGSLTITAVFQPVSAKRVSITYKSAALVPNALEKLFASNYDLLLSIFNPEGWLDITYIDQTHRIGRDDKGNVFYLQRC